MSETYQAYTCPTEKASGALLHACNHSHLNAWQIWERPPGPCPPFPDGFQHCHLGSLNVVRGMWQRLGVDMDWSLAIHPYGNPMQASCGP